jgi:hypothetical protein
VACVANTFQKLFWFKRLISKGVLAESEATKALDFEPKDITAVYLRAIARGEQGNYAGARED